MQQESLGILNLMFLMFSMNPHSLLLFKSLNFHVIGKCDVTFKVNL